uniref:Methyltransferase domain-containing protein n=1 Tax=Bracon brevicornis TaxID=1563983 RepID=A0A6V7K2H7_9HYME
MEEIYLDLDATGEAPIETVVVLFTMKYCESNLKISFISSPLAVATFPINLDGFSYEILKDSEEIPEEATSCQLPALKLTPTSFVAGLCACLRQIIKLKLTEDSDHYSRHLLGFKDSCLLAPSESSPWTRFCEVELISTLHHLGNIGEQLPETIARFEVHMSQPVRLHNIHKYTMSKKFTSNVTKDSSILPEHIFAEGSFMTLADVIIFVNIHILFHHLSSISLNSLLPLTSKWRDRMAAETAISKCLSAISLRQRPVSQIEHILPEVANQSLYKSDAKRYKPRNKVYTRQEEVEASLEIVETLEVKMDVSSTPFAADVPINWLEIPHEANPEGGSLPESRSKRKFEQLENLCRPVLKLARRGDVIVDFCAGSGHLGILIAYLRQDCTVVILENKEESLNRAKLRVKKLKLENVKFYQCNLDYFRGQFDIGTSLHACGVATDLVIQHCLQRNAVFVCCPCCYGSVQDLPHLTYPRSETFKRRMQLREYLVLGHAADQTHDEANKKTKQGYQCMAVIDTDRRLQAEERGYAVVLAKLVPETCTPKNNLLVGVPEERIVDDVLSVYLKDFL